MRKKGHGLVGTRPYHIWGNMKKRCNNPNSPDYPRYGGRGITYCEQWEKFEGFWEDMKEGYSDTLTLDRKDNNGNYSKDNCRWVELKKQQNNRRDNRIIRYKGKAYTLSELVDLKGMNYSTAMNRIRQGMAIEEVLSPPKEKEKITYNGVTKHVSDFAKDQGMTYHQLKKRLMRGWSIERALNQSLRIR